MRKRVSRGSFLLKKNSCPSPGKSISMLLTLPVHLIKLFPKRKKPSSTRLPSAKPGHGQCEDKDSRRDRLPLCHPMDPCSSKSDCLSVEMCLQEKSSPHSFTSYLQTHLTGKSDWIRDSATLWNSTCHTTDGEFSESSLAQFQHGKYLHERQGIR